MYQFLSGLPKKFLPNKPSKEVNKVASEDPAQKKKYAEDFMVQLRSYLLAFVLSGTDFIVAFQKYKNPLLKNYLAFASFCGDKIFYIVLVPALFWLVQGDPDLGRLFVILLMSCVYIGNFVKDMMGLPRPPSPPVVWAKREYDFGLPSMHSMNSIACSSFVLFYLRNKGLLEMDLLPMISILLLWSLSICFARMYRGVHSPADVITGFSIGVFMSWLWLRYAESILTLYYWEPTLQNLLILLSSALFIASIHPRCSISPSFSRSISCIAVVVGLIIGGWLQNSRDPLTKGLPTPDTFGGSIIQSLSPWIEITLHYLVESSVWQNFTISTWSIILRLTFGFLFFNIAFVTLDLLLYQFFKFLFRPALINNSIRKIGELCSVIALPSYYPGEDIKEEEEKTISHKKKKRERNSSSALVSRSLTITLVIIAIADTVPNLLQHMDDLLRTKFDQQF